MKLNLIIILLCILLSGCTSRAENESKSKPNPVASSAISNETLISSSASAQEPSSEAPSTSSIEVLPKTSTASGNSSASEAQDGSLDSEDESISSETTSASDIESGFLLSVKYEPPDYSAKTWATEDALLIEQVKNCLNDAVKRYYALDVSSVYLSLQFVDNKQTEDYHLWLDFTNDNKRAVVKYDGSFWGISVESSNTLKTILHELKPEVKITATFTLHEENQRIINATRNNVPPILNTILSDKEEATDIDLEAYSRIYTIEYRYDEQDYYYEIWRNQDTLDAVAIDQSDTVWQLVDIDFDLIVETVETNK